MLVYPPVYIHSISMYMYIHIIYICLFVCKGFQTSLRVFFQYFLTYHHAMMLVYPPIYIHSTSMYMYVHIIYICLFVCNLTPLRMPSHIVCIALSLSQSCSTTTKNDATSCSHVCIWLTSMPSPNWPGFEWWRLMKFDDGFECHCFDHSFPNAAILLCALCGFWVYMYPWVCPVLNQFRQQTWIHSFTFRVYTLAFWQPISNWSSQTSRWLFETWWLIGVPIKLTLNLLDIRAYMYHEASESICNPTRTHTLLVSFFHTHTWILFLDVSNLKLQYFKVKHAKAHMFVVTTSWHWFFSPKLKKKTITVNNGQSSCACAMPTPTVITSLSPASQVVCPDCHVCW